MEIHKSETLERKERVVVVRGDKEPSSLKYSEGKSGPTIWLKKDYDLKASMCGKGLLCPGDRFRDPVPDQRYEWRQL